ncbi:MAG: AsmA family protein [Balneolaceae bacterium]|nr:AsmA family protein [Balneolaceae bacterium]
MLLRWLHTTWTYLLRLVFGAALLLLLFGGIAFGLLQLEATRSWLVDRLERDYRTAFRSELDVGSLRGTLPFRASLDEVTVTHARTDGAAGADTLLSVERVDVTLDPWSLLSNRLSITGFSVQGPRLRLLTDSTGAYTWAQALAPARPDTAAAIRTAEREGDPAPETTSRSWFHNIRIIAPEVSITGGSVYVDRLHGAAGRAGLPQPLEIGELQASFFLELTERQRFWDIRSLSMQVGELQAGDVALSGQVYNDNRFLEFNGFTLRLGDSELELSGEVEGVDLYAGQLARQFREAHYDLNLGSSRLVLDDFRELSPVSPRWDAPSISACTRRDASTPFGWMNSVLAWARVS